MSGDATCSLVCKKCGRVVRCDPIVGPLSSVEKVLCTVCAPPRPEHEWMRLYHEAHLRPKHPITGKPLEPEDYSLWDRAQKVYEDYEYRREGHENGIRELLLYFLELEEFTSIIYRLESYGWSEEKAKLDAYGFLREAFLKSMPSLKKKPFYHSGNPAPLGKNNWFFEPGKSKAVLLTTIQKKALQLATEYAESERWLGRKGFRHRHEVELHDIVSYHTLTPSNPFSGDLVSGVDSRGGKVSATSDEADEDEANQDAEVLDDDSDDDDSEADSEAGEDRDDLGEDEESTLVYYAPRTGLIDAADHDLYWSSGLPVEDAEDAFVAAAKVVSRSQIEVLALASSHTTTATLYADEKAASAHGEVVLSLARQHFYRESRWSWVGIHLDCGGRTWWVATRAHTLLDDPRSRPATGPGQAVLGRSTSLSVRDKEGRSTKTAMPYREIAAALGKAASTVEKSHKRARIKLRNTDLAAQLGYGEHARTHYIERTLLGLLTVLLVRRIKKVS